MSHTVARRPRRRTTIRLLALVCAALPAFALGASPAAAEEPRPAFYQPPAELPDGPAGTLVRSEPMALRGYTRPAPGTTAWRLLYTSTGATGERTVVSGSLLLPSGGGEGVKGIVTVGVGTHGMGDACAPSRLLNAGMEPDLATMTALLRKNYAVAVSDYQGLGTPGLHAFAVNRALGQNLLDAVRAARQVPETGLPATSKVGITGYSEGGGAAASAAELAPTYAPELDVVGAVAGGTLSNPVTAVRPLDGNWFMGLLLAGAIGYGAAYDDLDLEPYLTPAGRWIMDNDTRSCQDWVARFIFNRMSWYTKSNPVKDPAWQARMKENVVGQLRPAAPVYLYHGRFDEAVFYTQTTSTRNAWCKQRANVRFRLNPVTEHFTTQVVEEPIAFRWLDDRFAGKPAVPNC